MHEPDFDVPDEQLRAARSVKWTHYPADVLPAWVAEMDVRPCGAVTAALHEAVDRGELGYPAPAAATELPLATAEVLDARLGWAVDPELVVPCGDVMAGVRLVLETLCDPAPVVVPLPSYPPFLQVVPVTGRTLVPLPLPEAGGRAGLDLAALDRALAGGARTLLLSSPHNPTGRVWTRAELEGVRDVVRRHGARVISDEIHAFLTLPGAVHVPYASLEGTAEHTSTVVSASKAWNVPGLKCAQIVAGGRRDAVALQAAPLVANHGLSPLGVAGTVAAYRHGGPWLDGLVAALDARRNLFGRLLAERLPGARWAPMEATYLAWVDASGTSTSADTGTSTGTGSGDPAVRALRTGRVAVGRGRDFAPDGDPRGYERHVRVTLATSTERLERIVDGLSQAWAAG